MRRLVLAALAASVSAKAQSFPPSTVYLATADFASGRLIAKEQVISSEPGANHDPVWSPDGQLIGYMSVQPGVGSQAFVIRSAISGREIRRVSVTVEDFAPLVWVENALYGTGGRGRNGTGIY